MARAVPAKPRGDRRQVGAVFRHAGLLAMLAFTWSAPPSCKAAAETPPPAQTPAQTTAPSPPPPPATTSIAVLESDLPSALRNADLPGVRAAVDRLRETLGPKAGQPEFPSTHYPPPDGTPFPASRAWTYLERELDRLETRLVWRTNPEGDPERMDEGLRSVAAPVRVLAILARIDPISRPHVLPLVREGADFLVRRQHASGVFPFPVGPALGNARSASGTAAARLVRNHPDWVEDGWVTEDGEDGGLQYDTGLCGVALLEAHAITGHAAYLDAARRAADWVRTRPLVANWNYNAFGVSLLARLHKTTGDPRLIDTLAHRLTLGVLPGQLPDGRWVDPHNARFVYHNILLRALLDAEEVLPPDHPARPETARALQRALDHAVAATLRAGYAGTFIDTFSRAAARPGAGPEVKRALNTALNAALGRRHRAPAPGDAIIDFLATCPPRRPTTP